MLDQMFMQVLDMSRTASVSIFIILAVRLFLKNAPKFVSYMLWFVVLFRLLCPISIESMVSLIPNMTPTSYHYTLEEEVISVQDAGKAAYHAIDHFLQDGFEDLQLETATEMTLTDENGNTKSISVQLSEIIILLGQYVWLIGMTIMFLYSIVSYYNMYRKVQTALPFKDSRNVLSKDNAYKNRIYLVDNSISPFVMGIFQPKIYMPMHLEAKEREYILLHEQFHIKRGDHIVKVLAFIALCIHWFNPLVWLAFFISSKDMEMSCDEAVIKRIGMEIKADYSTSLLSLAVGKQMKLGIPLAFGEVDTKTRIKNLAAWKMPDKKKLSFTIIATVILMLCLLTDPIVMISSETETENSHTLKDKEFQLEMDIEEHYITSTGDPSNVYYIDENNILWGCGLNTYGQLGQGTKDNMRHQEMVKIAENVVHVDFSQNGFVVYLTADHKLYGLGNSGCGALQQYDTFNQERYFNYGLETYSVETPYLLMEDVIYARCGKTDVVCMTRDGSVWTWGTVYVSGSFPEITAHYIPNPVKILENAVLVTGGCFNHAALLKDGTLWTWGYNLAGNCGVADMPLIAEPVKVAEDVVMVWTGTMQYNIDCFDYISETNLEYPRHYENTLIKKSDGSYWICGANVGRTIQYISDYYELAEIEMVCTHEFWPIESAGADIPISLE